MFVKEKLEGSDFFDTGMSVEELETKRAASEAEAMREFDALVDKVRAWVAANANNIASFMAYFEDDEYEINVYRFMSAIESARTDEIKMFMKDHRIPFEDGYIEVLFKKNGGK